MTPELLERVRKLDEEYFGKRDLLRLVLALKSQVDSMVERPTRTNVHKQAGDALFVLVSIARNNNWDLKELLQDRVIEVEERRENRHYYEAHVTVEPVFDDKLEWLKSLGEEYGFHMADLLMKKRVADTAVRSQHDAFLTGRGVSYSDLEDRTVRFVKVLQDEGYQVWRSKIESTINDTRYHDAFCPLDRDALPEKERNPRAPADGALPGRKDP